MGSVMRKLIVLLTLLFAFEAFSDSSSPLPQTQQSPLAMQNQVIGPFSTIGDVLSLQSSLPVVPVRDYVQILGIGTNEKLDYATQEFTHFDITPIGQDMQLKRNLSVVQYDLLLTGWLDDIYKNRFRNNVWALKYFSRALAEFAYAYNGYISKEFYSRVIERYKRYLDIDNEIRKIEVKSDIKYSLAKLYAAGCIYTGEIKDSKDALEKMSRIPHDASLYFMPEQADELYQEGTFTTKESEMLTDTQVNKDKKVLGYYAGYEHGDNLYYVCLAYYPQFKEMRKSAQIKLVNDIYTYNPTLMISPPIKRGRYAWDYFLDCFWPEKNPQLMKYCLKPYCNWLILPVLSEKG